MSAMASQITGVSIVYSTVCWGTDQRKHENSTSLAFVRGIHRWPVNSPPKGQQRGKCFHLRFFMGIQHNDSADRGIHMFYGLQICDILHKACRTEKPVAGSWQHTSIKGVSFYRPLHCLFNSLPNKPTMRKMCPCHDVVMIYITRSKATWYIFWSLLIAPKFEFLQITALCKT